MNEPCPACLSGPSGSSGHDALMARYVGSNGISLRCRNCQSFWVRKPERGGGFSWEEVSERTARSPGTGIAVPPSANDATTPRALPFREDPEFARFVSAVLGKMVGTRRSPRPPLPPVAPAPPARNPTIG